MTQEVKKVYNVDGTGTIRYQETTTEVSEYGFRLVHRDDESNRDCSLWDVYYKGDLLTECEDMYNVYTDWVLAWSGEKTLDFTIEAREELHDPLIRAFSHVMDAHRGLKDL